MASTARNLKMHKLKSHNALERTNCITLTMHNFPFLWCVLVPFPTQTPEPTSSMNTDVLSPPLPPPMTDECTEETDSPHGEGPPLVGTRLTLVYDFVAENDGEMTVDGGQVVTLVTPRDQSGDTEWYLVQNKKGEQGYVPANFLIATN